MPFQFATPVRQNPTREPGVWSIQFISTVRIEIMEGFLEPTPQKKQKRPSRISGIGRFRFGGNKSYRCGACCGAVSTMALESAETGLVFVDEVVLTWRGRHKMN